MQLRTCLLNLIKQIVDTRAAMEPVFIARGQNADISAKIQVFGPPGFEGIQADCSTRGMVRPDVSETLDDMLAILRQTEAGSTEEVYLSKRHYSDLQSRRGLRTGAVRRFLRSDKEMYLAIYCHDAELAGAVAEAIAPLLDYAIEAHPEMLGIEAARAG